MNNKITVLQQYRKRLNIPLYDVAHLLKIDVSQLAKIEKGLIKPKISIILLYHMLFDAPVLDMLIEHSDDLKVQVMRRSSSLISNLKIDQPPKSFQRIRFIENFVNKINSESNDG